MVKKIEVKIEDIVAIATLLDDKAPKTCEAILGVLPIENTAFHNYWAGEGIHIDETHCEKLKGLRVPPENQTVYPSRGDIAFSTPGYQEINIVYNRCQFRGPTGDQPNNIFARITENLDNFEIVCKRIHLEGIKKIYIKEKK